MTAVVQDIRHGVRLLWRTPSVALLAIAALALGSGASTAIFSVVDAALWKPLPYRDAGRLLVVWEKNPALDRYRMYVAPANLPAWRQNHSFDGLAEVVAGRINLTGGPNGHIDPEELGVERVSADLFPLLGVAPAIGRTFRGEEDRPGQPGVVILSYRLWQQRFAGDAGIAGKTIRLRDQPYQVVGVMPARFSVLDPKIDLWVPLALDPYDPRVAKARMLAVVGRLKNGVTIEQADREMAGIGAQLEQSNAALNKGWRPALYSYRNQIVGKTETALHIIMAAVGLLILMACANVANLLLARGASRQRELAVRGALGASRGRIVAQLLGESTALSLAGGLAGLLLAPAILAALTRLGAGTVPRIDEARFDLRMFLFAVGVSLLSGLLFGMVPAIQGSGAHLQAALAEEGRGGTTGRSGRIARSLLVVIEVALAVVVLIASGLLMRSFLRLRATDPGFRGDSVLTFRLPLGGGRNSAPERRAAFLDRVAANLSAIPGTESVGAVDSLPLTGLGAGSSFVISGQPEPPAEKRPLGLVRSITAGYFQTMGIRMISGRQFAGSDTAAAPAVAIIDDWMARRFFPASDPLGATLTLDQPARKSVTIVGVARSVKPDKMEGSEWPTIYLPYAQRPQVAMTIVLRTGQSPQSLAPTVERQIHQLDPDQPVVDVRPMEQIVSESLASARFDALLLGGFAAIAFLLCAVGIYGVVSYDASGRTREIGIRMAMGAQPIDILRLILGQGAGLAGCGLAVGLISAFALTRLMESMLYQVKPSDFPTFAAMAALLGAVAIFASYLPSRRAMALDPMAALRHE